MPELFNRIRNVFNNIKNIDNIKSDISSLKKDYVESYYSPYHNYSQIYAAPFDGEKTPGEMGAAKNYKLLYEYLRIRSWQAYLESEIAQIVINKYNLWIIGKGLKIQPEPVKEVLEQEGIKLNENFVNQSESRFNLWTSSRYSDYSKMTSIDYIASEAHKNAIIGGDCLVINRSDNGYSNIQLIDGAHIITPFLETHYIREAENRGNRIEYGIELNISNEHIAYYVYGSDNKIYRVPRYGEKSGQLMAYMIYGNKYRIDNVRGLPLIAAILETLKKLDRYKEATVGSAEERQKIAYSVEHSPDSTGENPFIAKIQQARDLGFGEASETKSTDAYESAATKIAATTNKQVFNMPIGGTLNLLESKNELYFKDFYTTNIQLVCASIGLPFEVAMSMYNSNYSASRAAIKDWEHSMKTNREKFANQFYKNYYNFWLNVEILKGKIQADGYLKALLNNDHMVVEAYTNARFRGVNVPHIDPLKEVLAARKRLGDETTPLTDYDYETENLGGNDFSQIMEKIKLQKQIIPNNSQINETNKK